MLLEIIRFAVIGASAGAVIALLALGVNVVNRTSKVVNFSHAAIAVASAYLYRDFLGFAPWYLALILAIICGALIGALIEFAVLRPMRNASTLPKAIATIGVLLVLQALLIIRYGNNAVVVPAFLPVDAIEVAGISIGLDKLFALVIAVALTAVLAWFYSRSSFGIATTAVSVSSRSVAALGRWSPRRVSLINWMIAGGLAAFAGILLAPGTSLTPAMTITLIVPMLSAALIGRLHSFWWTLAGGIGIGILQTEISVFFPDIQGLDATIPFIIIVIVLALRGRALPARGEDVDQLPAIGTGRIPTLPVLILSAVMVVLIMWVLPIKWVEAVGVGLIAAIILLSLVVVVGYAGQLSLASYALAGIAALVAAQLVANAGWSFLPAALVGVAATIPVGFLFGLPAVRTRGTSLAIVTLGLAVSVQVMILNNQFFSNGISGLNVGDIDIFGIDITNLMEPRRYALLVLIVFVLLGLMVLNIRRSATGRRMIAVRSNERAAASLGIHVPRTKLHAFIVSALIAGAGGVLLAFTNGIVSLANPGGQFDPTFSLNAIAQSTIGGVGYVAGAIFGTLLVPGAVLSTFLQTFLSGAWFNLFGGLLLLVTVITQPSGVVSIMAKQFGYLMRKLRLIKAPAAHDRSSLADAKVEPAESAHLAARDLSISFGGTPALDGVDLDVHGGRVLGIIGPNGAGKTTLVDAITGFNMAKGSVKVDGEEIIGMQPGRRARYHGLSRSFQSLELFEDLSVFDNLVVPADAASPWTASLRDGVAPPRRVLTSSASAAVKTLGLEDRLDDMPADLSYGERRLLAIARSLVSRPRILLLDEPAAGLGAEERLELRRLVRTIAEDWNIGVLIIEHDVDLVLGVSDSVVALDFGKVIARGTPAEIRADEAVIAAYLGTPESHEAGTDPEGDTATITSATDDSVGGASPKGVHA